MMPPEAVLLYTAAAAALAVLYRHFGESNLRHIPAVGGSSLPGLSYLGALNYHKRYREIIREGYHRHKGRLFKVALFDRWLVVTTGRKLVEELQRFPDDQVSFLHGTAEILGIAYVFGMEVWEPPYHVTIIRSTLTQHIASLFGALHQEMENAFDDVVPAKHDEWTAIPAAPIVRELVARISGRAFVGLPFCRDPDYIDLAINLSAGFSRMRIYLAMAPSTLKPFIARYFSGIDGRVKQGMHLLSPAVSERMRILESHGIEEYPDKPEDLLQWLTEEAFQRGQSAETVVRTIMLAIFAATHTSSNTFLHALYHIAAHPALLGPLRDEVERALHEEGWTKNGIAKMYKLDSLMKETLRLNSIHTNSIPRKVLKPVTFSDGTYLPEGSLVITPAIPTHHDEEYYKDSDVFDPWRFSHARTEDEAGTKQQFVATSSEYIAWGFGRHSCPGRFFAAAELKAMMAYIVMQYDIKFEQENSRPENVHSILAVSPDPAAKVLFRRRKL